jgi:CelD/BcsL family acetyltransferase involved in cellulose biosynthesis
LNELRTSLLAVTEPSWSDFALNHPGALPYHHPAWMDVLVDTYGFDTFALVAHSPAGDIVGGVSFVTLGGGLRRKRWVALPFTDACPPLTTPELSKEELGALVADAGERAGVNAIEVRGALDLPGAQIERGVVHQLALSDPDELFSGFESQVRRNIRKADRSGLTLRVAEREEDLTDVYFALHADTRRRLGVPTQPRRFAAVWRRMLAAGLGFAFLVYHEQEPIAGAVFLEWNGVVVYKFGASDARHWALRPNNLIFWEAIKRAHGQGARVLDFGRSDLEDEGLRAFKRSWGAVEEPLFYTMLGRPAESSSGSAERLLKPLLRRSPVWVGRGLGELFYRFGA